MKNFHWGHGLAIALGCFMVFVLFLILVFPHGKQNSELITNNYYEEELEYQHVIDSKKNADLLAEKPKYEQSKNGIKITFPESVNIDNNKIDFVLFRTNDSNLDVKKELQVKNNILFIPGNIMVMGSYTLKVKWSENKKPYQIDYDILWK